MDNSSKAGQQRVLLVAAAAAAAAVGVAADAGMRSGSNDNMGINVAAAM